MGWSNRIVIECKTSPGSRVFVPKLCMLPAFLKNPSAIPDKALQHWAEKLHTMLNCSSFCSVYKRIFTPFILKSRVINLSTAGIPMQRRSGYTGSTRNNLLQNGHWSDSWHSSEGLIKNDIFATQLRFAARWVCMYWNHLKFPWLKNAGGILYLTRET